MTRRFADIKRHVDTDPGYQAEADEMTRAMEDALTLGRIRESRGMTQTAVAGALGQTQANVSRIEHQDDLYLSTLREYVEALGGRLQISAIFDDQTILLTPPGRQTEREERPAIVQEREPRAGQERGVPTPAVANERGGHGGRAT